MTCSYIVHAFGHVGRKPGLTNTYTEWKKKRGIGKLRDTSASGLWFSHLGYGRKVIVFAVHVDGSGKWKKRILSLPLVPLKHARDG